MLRGLVFFWRSHLAVTLGAAVAAAVLTGALVVGDSVRGSLKALVLDRLGEVDIAVVSDGFVRKSLAADLELAASGRLELAPAILVRGAVTRSADDERQLRASDVQVFGVGPGWNELFPRTAAFEFERAPGQLAPSAVVNETLAQELEVSVGDQILVTVERPAEVPRETLVGRKDAGEPIQRLRLAVTQVIPDSGAGGFRFSPRQAAPRNLFLELSRLDRALFGRRRAEQGPGGRVNTLLVASKSDEALTADEARSLLARSVTLDDLSLTVRAGEKSLHLGSRQFVLSDPLTTAVSEFAGKHQIEARESLTYLVNSFETSRGMLPYSTVTALEPGAGSSLENLTLLDGRPAPALAANEILIDRWAAEDLGTEIGETVTLNFFRLGERDELSEDSIELVLAGVVDMAGPAIDAGLTPDFPGMADAEDIAGWDPPFPVDLALIRERDEKYWDLHRAAPKAFVSLATGRRLWASRFGETTIIEMAGGEAQSGDQLVERLESEFAPALATAGAGGLSILDLRADGLEAARGATDFGGLFLALSFFLIGSAALLVALLFRLGVEQRAREVGLLRAVGYSETKVRNRFLVEGMALAALGSSLGIAGAVGYAAAMLAALRTWWRAAVGTSTLELHVVPGSLGLGWLISIATVALSLWLALRQLRRVPTPSLLAGSVEAATARKARVRSKTVAAASALLATLLLASSPFLGSQGLPLVSMGIGFALLVAGIAFFAHRIRSGRRGANRLSERPVMTMGARNSSRNPGRSLASVALIASSVFLLVVVGANRRSATIDVDAANSGAGGFRLLAVSDVPVLVDLNSRERRADLGFSSEASEALEDSRIVPLRRLAGEDASCLNLYRPGRPTVLGAPPELIERGGFSFQSAAQDVDNPWELLEREIEPGVVPAIADYNSAMWVLHLGLGKDLVIPNQNGQEIRLRLVGLLKKSLFQSEILISEQAFVEHFPREDGYSFFLVETPAGDDEAQTTTTEILEGNLDRFGLDVTSSAERIASFQAVENTYIATFQTLGGLGLLLGTIGLGVVLLRNVLERRGELATLRAFGFRKSLLAKMVLAENGSLLLAGIGIGTVAGLIGVLPNLLSEGHLPPGLSLIATVALVFVVGMAASSFAVAGTVRAPLLPALKGN